MYAPPGALPVAATTQRRNAWPLAAICCLALIGILLAGTIVLALIPVYLPSKQATLNNNTADGNDTFFLQYVADGDESSSFTGSATNLVEIRERMNTALGLNNELDITAADVQTTFVRRRRSLLLSRTKRTIKNKCLLRCKPRFSSTCLSRRCRDNVRNRVQNACNNVRTVPSVPFRVQNRQFGVRNVSLSLTFVGLSLSRPAGFVGEPSNYTVFVAVRSGEFNDSTIWSEGVTPYGNCSIVISAGVSVTISNSVMDLIVKQWDIYGSLGMGASIHDSFAFKYPTNLVVRSGGNLQDRTGGKIIFTRAGTLLTIYPGASFTGSNTVLRTFTNLPAANNAGENFTLGSSITGPFTSGIISTTVIQSFRAIAFIVSASGNFLDSGTWLGGTVPTPAVCNLVGGCTLYISPGFALSTTSLNGQLNLNFNQIIVSTGASLQLGASGTNAFTFVFAVNLIVQSGGTLRDQTSGGRLYFRSGSLTTLYPGASFVGVNTVVYQYTSLPTTGSLGASTVFGSSISGPFTFAVLLSGQIQTFNSVTFIVSVTGSFTVTGTWLGGLVPTADLCALVGGCALYISPGCTLSTASLNGQLNINILSITIPNGASCQLGSSGAISFTFVFAVNLIIQRGGTLQDQTSGGRLYLVSGSICTFYPGAVFTGTNTVVYQYTSLPATGSLGASTVFGSSISGPFTFAILLGGQIQTFASVTFFAVVSGDFGAGGSWLGGIAPTADLCNLANGCGLYIAPGCVLSTVSLNGELNINFNAILVARGATFQLGSAGLLNGFRFRFPFIFDIFGTLSFLPTAGGSIYLPYGCAFNFYAGAIFQSVVVITIRIYDIFIGGEGKILIFIDSLFTGPYFVYITFAGEVIESSGPATTPTSATTQIMTTEDLIDMTASPVTNALLG